MFLFLISICLIQFVRAQQECYYGANATHRGPTNLVPCSDNGQSSCCLLGDICLAGGACWNEATGDSYQYGCTDITYTDASCPKKCGWDTSRSPWTALEFCKDVSGASNTWICQSPETCDCDWDWSLGLQVLPPQGCQAMGSLARVAFFAPSTLVPYASLPTTVGGATGYYSQVRVGGSISWSGPLITYTPSSLGPPTSYSAPTTILQLAPHATPVATTIGAAHLPDSSSSIVTQSFASSDVIPSAGSSSTTKPSATSSVSDASNTAPASISPATPSATPSASATSSGLSTGAKIGIGVGIGGAVCVLALAGVIVYLCGRLHQRRDANHLHHKQPHPHGVQPYPQGPAPYGAPYGQYPPQGYHQDMYASQQPLGHMGTGNMNPAGPIFSPAPSMSEHNFARPGHEKAMAELGTEQHVHELASEAKEA